MTQIVNQFRFIKCRPHCPGAKSGVGGRAIGQLEPQINSTDYVQNGDIYAPRGLALLEKRAPGLQMEPPHKHKDGRYSLNCPLDANIRN